VIRRSIIGFLVIAIWSGCDPDSLGSFDPVSYPPVIDSLQILNTVFDTDTILVGDERLPEDELLIPVQASVHLVSSITRTRFSVRVTTPEGALIPSTGSFNDDGIFPDAVPSDGRYSTEITFSILRSLTGPLYISIAAEGEGDLISNTVSGRISIIRANAPPVLSDLMADTLISLSGGNTTLQLRITAADSNGLDDVRRVWFDSYLPSGSPSSGNPFLMFDDGNSGGISGDRIAQDGIFGLTVAFLGASPGTYRFDFRATDRSRDTSNVIQHFLTVVP